MTPVTPVKTPCWAGPVLSLAAAYNLVWGTLVVLFPAAFFQAAGMPSPRYPELWQCIGMIVGVYGVGYAIASRDPVRWWPIVLVGFLGKVFGPIGFGIALMRETLPLHFGWVIVGNDLIWWVPFGLILITAWKRYRSLEGLLECRIPSH